jgi:hypothetical protein
MMKQGANSEDDLIIALAADLARQGYEVLREPTLAELPEFLRGYRPDLIAHRGDEHLVVEIKANDRPPHWRELAEAVGRHPGWNLQLIMAAPTRGNITSFPQPPSQDDIRRQLAAAQRIYDSGEHAAALLLLWSLLEAAAYYRLGDLGLAVNRPKTPIALIKDLVSFEILQQEEYDDLAAVTALRNAAAHGHSTLLVDRATFSKLVSLIERLLEQPEVIDAVTTD